MGAFLTQVEADDLVITQIKVGFEGQHQRSIIRIDLEGNVAAYDIPFFKIAGFK